MVWEIIFLLVILKIPIVYLCGVIWWAIRADGSEPADPVAVAQLSDTPPAGGPPRRRRRGGRRPLRPHTPGHGSGVTPPAQRGTVHS